MNHHEDEQPNESVRGRPKRAVPFIRSTARGRGRGGDPGQSSYAERGYGRGRGRARGAPFAPGISRGGPSAPSGISRGPATSRHFGKMSTGPPNHALPPKPQFSATLEDAEEKRVFGSYGTGTRTINHGTAPNPPRPRRRFRPGTKAKPQNDKSIQPTHDSVVPTGESSTAFQPASHITDSACPTCDSPPTKRQRLEELAMSMSDSRTLVVPDPRVKVEKEPEPSIDAFQEQPGTGTKFISYDDHPMCRFSCGKPPNEVRNNRRLIKEQEVAALRELGMDIDAVFIRDDGIAIDWSRQAESKAMNTSATESLPYSSESEPIAMTHEPPLPKTSSAPSTLRGPLPPHLNPIAASINSPPPRRSTTPTSTEIAYREVRIPPRHLPRHGDTRKLEIWVLEQMRLLEAELGPVLLPPPELLGLGEYITGQDIFEGPRVRIRYKRPVRIHGPPGEQSGALLESNSLVEPFEGSPTAPCDHPSPSTSLPDLPLPSITHLAPSGSPTPPSSPPLVKDEPDELAHDPPSPLASPDPAPPTAELSEELPAPTQEAGHPPPPQPSENAAGKQRASSHNETQIGASTSSSNEDLDELQRLRRDLELSRLEAEKKHRDLERRILELSEKHSEIEAPQPGLGEPSPITPGPGGSLRIADEARSKLLVLRRGKHDKTRRLLKTSDSTILHVSWLGAMQLINRDSRRIVATGFEAGAPESISVDDACSLSASYTALGLVGSEFQLAIATLGGESFKFLSLQDQPHEAKGVCAVVPVNPQSVITLGHDHHYFHWKFDGDWCSESTTLLQSLPKLHLCTALAFEPFHNNIITAGSDSTKRSKLTLHNLVDSEHIPNTAELSNHPHHIHIDPDNPSLFTLELARLDDQFQVHDLRLPLYQCVQKFGYQNVTLERAEFRVRGSTRGHHFARGDTGIVRLWDRRAVQSYQTVSVIPHQKVVEVILDRTTLTCATEAHHVVTYPTF